MGPLVQNDFFKFIVFLGSIIEIEIEKTRAKTTLKELSVKHEERDITGRSRN
jgi:hypothetical protein